MDKTIRRHENCIIGLPRCDFVFSSTRKCFIAYGFNKSNFEKDILCQLSEERGIHPVEAGGMLSPGQNAFCAKICSQIITSQFCAVLLNNDDAQGQEIPNANVNMEYGLILGFNKYVLPFQLATQKLPFNVAGLDTIKYTPQSFKTLASSAIDQAIRDTQQETTSAPPLDQDINAFLLSKKVLMSEIENPGSRDMYRMGEPLGFNLLHDFAAVQYVFFGNFTTLRAETIVGRVRTLSEIVDERRNSIGYRVHSGVATPAQAEFAERMWSDLRIWVAVTTETDKQSLVQALRPLKYHFEAFSIDEIRSALSQRGDAAGAAAS